MEETASSGMTWSDVHAALGTALGIAERLVEGSDQLPGGPQLAELIELAGTVDQVVEKLGTVRGELSYRARSAFGWKPNKFVHPELGWVAKRERVYSRTWNLRRAFGRVAPMLLCDAETGEADMPFKAEDVERLLRRFEAVASISGMKSTAMRSLGLAVEDLYDDEEKPKRVTIVRDPSKATRR
jgi:hypothetical protein